MLEPHNLEAEQTGNRATDNRAELGETPKGE